MDTKKYIHSETPCRYSFSKLILLQQMIPNGMAHICIILQIFAALANYYYCNWALAYLVANVSTVANYSCLTCA